VITISWITKRCATCGNEYIGDSNFVGEACCLACASNQKVTSVGAGLSQHNVNRRGQIVTLTNKIKAAFEENKFAKMYGRGRNLKNLIKISQKKDSAFIETLEYREAVEILDRFVRCELNLDSVATDRKHTSRKSSPVRKRKKKKRKMRPGLIFTAFESNRRRH
jgi:hypothetical protein